MFNVFEQPWLLFAVSFLVLLIIYITTLERKFYWLSLIILLCLVVLNLLLEAKLFFLSANLIIILKILLPLAAVGLAVWLVISILQLKDPASNIWLLPLAIMALGFCLDRLVKTDAEKINMVISKCQQAVQQENRPLFSSVVSEQYRDSYHSSKAALLQHFDNYFDQPLCDSLTKTYMQITRKDATAIVDLAFFITFNPKSFPMRDYDVANATVSLRIRLRKEPDRQWRIYETEITSVNNQPFSWSAVGR